MTRRPSRGALSLLLACLGLSGCLAVFGDYQTGATCGDGVKNGAETDVDCGGSCPGKCADTKACAGDADCHSGTCTRGACAEVSCSDGVKNGAETDVDCGGSCPARCAEAKGCSVAADCQAGTCTGGTCHAPTCHDGVKNGAETDRDCGGPTCPACALGSRCAADKDCASMGCSAATATCVAPCADGRKDGAETDVDCGGGCALCAAGQRCLSDADCAGDACDAASLRCVADACTDHHKDGAETDVDCGGAKCPGCKVGGACQNDGDCASQGCDAGTKKCDSTRCHDGLKDDAETDVDCGGGTCAPCATGKACGGDPDCATAACDAQSKQCVADQCGDHLKDGAETDVDCGGGTCPVCVLGAHCLADADCVTGGCDVATKLCDPNQCHDGIKNDAETGVDCGGGTCPACGVGLGCAVNADCQSVACDAGSNQCVADPCQDHHQDNAETDVDCGGGTCGACGLNLGCASDADCASGGCDAVSKLCVSPCADHQKDGAETDVDCGGGTCGVCLFGNACKGNSDCQSGTCGAGTCTRAITAVTLGYQHTCALLAGGKVKCWGLGVNGELGQGTTAIIGNHNLAEMGANLKTTDLGTGRSATKLAAGADHTCAILDDGSLKCWGKNNSGQLGLGISDYVGDDPNEMGDNLPAVALGAGRTATAVAAGGDHTCAILDDKTLKCWGSNGSGELGLGDITSRGLAAGQMGANLPVVDLGTGRTAKAIALGAFHACAILDDGSVKCWGEGGDGELGLGDSSSRGRDPNQMGDNLPALSLGTNRKAVAIGAGYAHACAVLDDATVKCWGYNLDGRLGVGDSVARGNMPGQMGDALLPIALGTGRTVKALAMGTNHACGLLDDLSIKCWGTGTLGLGDTNTRGKTALSMGDNLPAVQLGTGRTPFLLSAGGGSSCVLLDNDTLKCWGSNNYGQLGLGDANDRGANPGEMGDALPTVSLF